MVSQANLHEVDWSKMPVPADDGAARDLPGRRLPRIALPATDGSQVTLADLPGRVVVYVYPLTARPGVALPDGWDEIPGARGCTPQSCAFRDHFRELRSAGACSVFGLSTQDTAFQKEAASRLHLPFALLSDERHALTQALGLPTFTVSNRTFLKRLAMIIDNGHIRHVFYPVFPPGLNAADVLDWLKANPA